MGIRGFLIVLICAIALGVIARFLDVPDVTDVFARDDSVAEPIAESALGGPTEESAELAVKSSVGLSWSSVEVFVDDRWSTVPVEGGRFTPAGTGPWRVRAPGHLEARAEGPAVELVPGALLEILGDAANLEVLATAIEARLLEQQLGASPFAALERLSDRLAWVVRTEGCWRELVGETLEVEADLAGGRRLTIAWDPTSGARCEVDLEQILTDRRTAPFALRFVDEAGAPVAGARVTFGSASKALRFRPLDPATGRNCARIDVDTTPQPEGVSDADGLVRFEGVGLGQTLGVLAWDPTTGAWQRTTLEHDGSEHSIALSNEGVTVTGQLVLPDDHPEDAVTRADFELVWRQSIEGVGTGLWVAANAAELHDHPVGPDGTFELVTTGPRSGTSARWELSLDVLAPHCALASSATLTELGSAVEVGEVSLELAQPWIRVANPRTGGTSSGWIVPLGEDAEPQWAVRAVSVSGALELHLVPARGADGYVARHDSREQALEMPESRPAVFLLRSAEGDRWFDTVDGQLEELQCREVELRVLVAGQAPEGAWHLSVESGSAESKLITLGSEWLGEALRLNAKVPVGARLRWSKEEGASVPLDSATIDCVLR